MKKLLLFVALMACAATSGAKDIEGAFGFKLGENFDRGKEKFLTFTQEFRGIYTSEKYKHPTPTPGFFYKNYTLLINTDKKIAAITAYLPLQDYKDFNECKSKSEKIVDLLALQYDTVADKFYTENDKYKAANHTINKGERYINVECNDFSDSESLSVEIMDRGLMKTLPDPLSEPKIEGAFGFKFGEKFNLARKDYEVNKNFDSPNIEAIHLRHNIHSPFDEYVLMVDPKTIEIYAIHAIQYNSKRCPSIIDEYGRAIEDKYDIGMKKESSKFSEDLSYSRDYILISVSCIYQDILTNTTEGYPKFNIMYIDKKGFEKAHTSSEQLKIERAERINKSLL